MPQAADLILKVNGEPVTGVLLMGCEGLGR